MIAFTLSIIPTAQARARHGVVKGRSMTFESHTKKPDLDNLTKQLKDAMTRLQFWHDDRQVVRLACEKRYGETGRWEVCIREMMEGETI